MNRIKFIWIVSILTVGVLTGGEISLKPFQNQLDALKKANGFPGGNVCILIGDQEVIQLSTGVSDRTTGRLMEISDRMFSGSVGKTYASAVLLQLVEEGRIGLDDKISKYLGEESWFTRLDNSSDITVRMLMNHTSGINDHIMAETFRTSIIQTPHKLYQPEELVAHVLDKPSLFPPGEGWSYTDTNYILVGMIIEQVTGRPFYDELVERFLTPLELFQTTPSIGSEYPGLIMGYTGPEPFNFPHEVLVNGRYVIATQFEWTGGGLISNTYELAKWAKDLYSGKLLKSETMKELLTARSYEDGTISEYSYGLGVMIWETDFGPAYGHGGIFPGYQTVIKHFPEYDFSIALQVNEDRTVNENLVYVYDFADSFAPLVVNYLNRIH